MTTFTTLLSNYVPLLIPLQVILPLICATILIFFKNYKFSLKLTTVFLIISWFISLILVTYLHLLNASFINYLFGGFTSSIGIEYKLTNFSSIILFIINTIALISFAWGKKLIVEEVSSERVYLFNFLYLVFVTGLLGLVLTFDLFNAFVFLEVSSISSYAIIALNRKNKQAPMAAFNYLIIGSIGASLYVIAVAIIYSITGSLNMGIVFEQIDYQNNSIPLVIALVLIIIFIFIKSGCFPFYTWLPNSYSSSPFAFSSLMAGTTSKVVLFVFFKMVIMLIPNLNVVQLNVLSLFLTVIALLTIMLGSTLAIFQAELKKILAWSSISYMGYILLTISTFDPSTMIIVMVLIIGHSITKAGLFMVVGNIRYLEGSTLLSSLKGFMQKSMFNFVALIIFSLTIVGFPGTIGFSGKWLLLTHLLIHKFWFSSFILVISSTFAVIYMWRIIEAMKFVSNPPTLQDYYKNALQNPTSKPKIIEADFEPAINKKLPSHMTVWTLVALSLNIILSVLSGPLIHYLNKILINS